MRRAVFVMSMWGIACSGGGDGNTPKDGTTPVEYDDDLCDTILFYEVFGQSCFNIEQNLQRVLDSARDCNVDEDCQVISGRCNDHPWTGHCWIPVNTCSLFIPPPWPDDLPPHGAADLDYFIAAYTDAQCDFQGSSCGNCGTAPDVACVRGECVCVDEFACD